MLGIELMMACAPNVDPSLVEQVVMVESSGNPWAININTGDGEHPTVPGQWPPKSQDEAVAAATYLLENGYNFDSGLGQINSENYSWLEVSPESVFDPCTNLEAAQAVLTDCYQRATGHYNGQSALYAALSCYNTGSFTRGWANGYLARYGITEAGARRDSAANVAADNPYAADTAVFIRNQVADMSKNPTNEEFLMANIDARPVISETPDDMDVPGVQAEYDAAEADDWGAFEETALSEADAWDSNADLVVDGVAYSGSETAIMMGGRAVSRQ